MVRDFDCEAAGTDLQPAGNADSSVALLAYSVMPLPALDRLSSFIFSDWQSSNIHCMLARLLRLSICC